MFRGEMQHSYHHATFEISPNKRNPYACSENRSIIMEPVNFDYILYKHGDTLDRNMKEAAVVSHCSYEHLLTKKCVLCVFDFYFFIWSSRASSSLIFPFSSFVVSFFLWVCRVKRHKMQPRRSYTHTFLSHGRPQQQIKSDFMPTTVAQFDHDARVIVIPINAKNTQCSTAYKRARTHTHTDSLTQQ